MRARERERLERKSEEWRQRDQARSRFTDDLTEFLQQHGISDEQAAFELAVDLEPIMSALINGRASL